MNATYFRRTFVNSLKVFNAELREVSWQILRGCPLQTPNGQVRLHPTRPPAGEVGYLDQFLAASGVLRKRAWSRGGFMAAGFFQSQDFLIKFDRFFQIIHGGVQEVFLPCSWIESIRNRGYSPFSKSCSTILPRLTALRAAPLSNWSPLTRKRQPLSVTIQRVMAHFAIVFQRE